MTTDLTLPEDIHKKAVTEAFERAWADEDHMAAAIGDSVVFTPTGLGIARNLSDGEYLQAAAVLMADQRVAYDKGNLGKFRMGDLMRSYAAQNQFDTEAVVNHFNAITKVPKSVLKDYLRVACEIPQPDRKPTMSWTACIAALKIEGPKDPVAAADFHALKLKLLEDHSESKMGKRVVLAKLQAESARLRNEVGPAISPKAIDHKEILITNLIEWYQLKQITDTRLHLERFPDIPESAWFARMRQIEADIENLIVAFGHANWAEIQELPFQYFPK